MKLGAVGRVPQHIFWGGKCIRWVMFHSTHAMDHGRGLPRLPRENLFRGGAVPSNEGNRIIKRTNGDLFQITIIVQCFHRAYRLPFS